MVHGHDHVLSGHDSRSLDSDDADVMIAVRAGDRRRAAAALVARHGDVVYRYVLAMTGNGHLAEDIHQQVFLEAYRDLECFSGRSSLRVWLLGIARHRCIDALVVTRRWNDRFKNETETETEADDCAADRTIDRCRMQRILAGCLTRLTPASREAVMLRYQEELSYEEAAAVAGVCAATLQKRVTRALPLLRRYIRAELCSGAADPAE
jgi:RNA polymerase sigma-70 factor (ECF subfamily)